LEVPRGVGVAVISELRQPDDERITRRAALLGATHDFLLDSLFSALDGAADAAGRAHDGKPGEHYHSAGHRGIDGEVGVPTHALRERQSSVVVEAHEL